MSPPDRPEHAFSGHAQPRAECAQSARSRHEGDSANCARDPAQTENDIPDPLASGPVEYSTRERALLDGQPPEVIEAVETIKAFDPGWEVVAVVDDHETEGDDA